MLFAESPWLGRPEAARRAGFCCVESWWPPSGLDPTWPAELRRAGLRVTCINTFAGSIEAGDRGFVNNPSRQDEAVDAFRAAVELAVAVGADKINVPLGRALSHISRKTQLASVAAVLRDCAALASSADICVLVEPINELDNPGYLAPTARSAIDLIDRLGSESVRLLYDVYHAVRAGSDPLSEIYEVAPYVAHVQYADCPGRGAPGTGSSNLWGFLERLNGLGYEGAVGLEYLPGDRTVASLGFLAEAPSFAPFPCRQ
jgi:hydroxypyruvate isomerase